MKTLVLAAAFALHAGTAADAAACDLSGEWAVNIKSDSSGLPASAVSAVMVKQDVTTGRFTVASPNGTALWGKCTIASWD